MADVYAIFGTLLALGIVFPGFLTTWWLIAPQKVALAHRRLATGPKRTIVMGIITVIILAVPISILFAFSAPFSAFLGAVLIASTLAFAGMGAAGLASYMASQLQSRNKNLSDLAAFVRGAVALELAAAFPLIGWVLVIPLSFLAGLGAASFALLGWEAKQAAKAAPNIDASPTQV